MRLLLLVLLVGCATMTEPPGVVIDPPSHFATLWSDVEQCSGLLRPMSRVAFIVVPDVAVRPEGGAVPAYYDPNTRSIVLSAALLDAGTDSLAYAVGVEPYRLRVIRHEMLHALLDGIATGHPAEYFRERCGDVVTH